MTYTVKTQLTKYTENYEPIFIERTFTDLEEAIAYARECEHLEDHFVTDLYAPDPDEGKYQTIILSLNNDHEYSRLDWYREGLALAERKEETVVNANKNAETEQQVEENTEHVAENNTKYSAAVDDIKRDIKDSEERQRARDYDGYRLNSIYNLMMAQKTLLKERLGILPVVKLSYRDKDYSWTRTYFIPFLTAEEAKDMARFYKGLGWRFYDIQIEWYFFMHLTKGWHDEEFDQEVAGISPL